MDTAEINQIKESTQHLLEVMTMADFTIEVSLETPEKEQEVLGEVVNININMPEPQFLIGQSGQTLLDLQRLLRIILNKKIKKAFYVRLDINGYQKEKTEYLKNMARSLANEAALTKEKKTLPPMPAHERRIIHEELSQHLDVSTTSEGEGDKRCVAIIPK